MAVPVSRSSRFADVARALSIARFCNSRRLTTPEGLERVRDHEARYAMARRTRREWLNSGSYTSYLPGQFTTIAGLEGLPAGSLYFAGEHANSFYEFQGFLEGAALSGIAAAAAILKPAKR